MFKLETKWLDKLVKHFNSLDVNRTLSTWVKKIIITLQRESTRRTPVDTWLLRKSYNSYFTDWWLTGKLVNYRKYGIFVHEWTKYMQGRPFMTDALEENDSKVQLIMNREIEKMLNTLKI